MRLIRIDPEKTCTVSIRWTKPASYDVIVKGSHHDPDGWLYMILGYHGSSHPKVFYIGKVTASYVSERLRQRDHQWRYSMLRRRYPRHTFRVSLGAINMKGRCTDRRIDHIETLLIFTAWENQVHMINEQKWLTHGISAPYVVRNVGFCRPLPKEIHLGVFVR